MRVVSSGVVVALAGLFDSAGEMLYSCCGMNFCFVWFQTGTVLLFGTRHCGHGMSIPHWIVLLR